MQKPFKLRPPRQPRQRLEETLHRQIAQSLHLVLPPDVFWTTFPAGGGGKIRGAILLGLGMKRGVPDLLVIYQGIAYWMEIKTKSGSVSPAQHLCHETLVNSGCDVAIVRSIEDVCECLDQWQIPHKHIEVVPNG